MRHSGDRPGKQATAGVRRLADREDDVVGQLREQEDVGDVRVERLLEELARLAGGENDDRCTRVLADDCQLVVRQRLRVGREQDDVQVAAGECAGCLLRRRGDADELELGFLCEHLDQRGRALAGAAHEDADRLAVVVVVLVCHRRQPPWAIRSWRELRPSSTIVFCVSTVSGLSVAFTTGRSSNVQSSFLIT